MMLRSVSKIHSVGFNSVFHLVPWRLNLTAIALICGCTSTPSIAENNAHKFLTYELTADRHYVVELLANRSENLKFIVDTAAQSTAFFPYGLKSLQLESQELGSTQVWGAVGKTSVPYYRIQSLSGGGRTMRNFNALMALEVAEVDETMGGILGLDFLQNSIVEFDCASSRMIFHTRETLDDLKPRIVDHTPLRRDRFGFLRFTAKIDGANVSAVLDLGARRNVVNWKTASALSLTKNDDRLIDDEPITGSSGKSTKGLRKYPGAEINIGELRWRDQSLTISDLRVFSVLGMDHDAAAILGGAVFSDSRYIIDFRRGDLFFLSPSPGKHKCSSRPRSNIN